MTREEEIINAAKEHGKQTFFCDLVKSASSKGVNSAYGLGFIEGAVWADNNLSQQALAKELHRLGYGITLNGDIISKAEENKQIERYVEYQKNKLIEKACNWLEDNLVSFWEYKLYNNDIADDIAFVNNFKKAMEE